jgi:hypothetical protein
MSLMLSGLRSRLCLVCCILPLVHICINLSIFTAEALASAPGLASVSVPGTPGQPISLSASPSPTFAQPITPSASLSSTIAQPTTLPASPASASTQPTTLQPSTASASAPVTTGQTTPGIPPSVNDWRKGHNWFVNYTAGYHKAKAEKAQKTKAAIAASNAAAIQQKIDENSMSILSVRTCLEFAYIFAFFEQL